MASLHQLKIEDQIVEYKLTYRNQKKIILRFRDNQILISAPNKTALKVINQFVIKNWSKIVQFQENYQRYKKISFEWPYWITIFDQSIPIQFVSKSGKTKFVDNKLVIYYPGDKISLTKKIYNFLARYYKDWFWTRTEYWAQILDVKVKTIALRKMVSKWGVCYPQEKKIIYNSKLIHYSKDVIDYVIVHELAHLIYPNHSSKFWGLVRYHLPNYKYLKASLRF